MSDPRDILEIGGNRINRGAKCQSSNEQTGESPRSKFLSIWYRCCNVYGRMYRNQSQTAYEGRCPRCGTAVQARIGPGGTDQRIFIAK